jgi:hypothetical protein
MNGLALAKVGIKTSHRAIYFWNDCLLARNDNLIVD